MENNNAFVVDVNGMNLSWMEAVLEDEINEITEQIDLLIELAQRKAEKIKRVREMMNDYQQMFEDYVGEMTEGC